MEEELILKQKYQALRKKVNTIKNQINELQGVCDEVASSMQKCLLLDEKIVDAEILTNVKNDINKIYNELTSSIIPKINSKC